MMLLIVIISLAYVIVSLLIAYTKYHSVEYEYYPCSTVPKYHLGNINKCYGNVVRSVLYGLGYIPFWLMVTVWAFVLLLGLGLALVNIAEAIHMYVTN